MSIPAMDPQHFDGRLRELLGSECRVKVDFLLHLAEFERRKMHEALGYSSLWVYCREALGLPEGPTDRRTHAAAILQRFPFAADYLRDGRLWMTTLTLLEPVLTPDNARELFDAASKRSKQEVERLVAAVRSPEAVPVPEDRIRLLSPAKVRKHPAMRSAPPPTAAQETLITPPQPASPIDPPPCAAPARDSVEPVSATQFRITLTVSTEFREALEKVMDVMSHKVPDRRSLEPFLLAGLRAILAQDEKRHGEPTRAVAPRPRADPKPGTRGTIPAAVRREVWNRDGGRCSWTRANGRRCGSRYRLEIDHIVPVAKGGGSEPSNLRVTCRGCNALHARNEFGAERIERAIRRRRDGTCAGEGPRPNARGEPVRP